MSESWQAELEALGLILRGLAGCGVVEQATRLLADLGGSPGGEGRAGGLLRLAIAVGLSTGRRSDGSSDDAATAIDAAVAALSSSVHPFMYDLALFLAAKLEARPGADAGLRYARRVVEEQWVKRGASLLAMRAQVASRPPRVRTGPLVPPCPSG